MNQSVHRYVLAGLIAAVAGTPALADKMYLHGVVRDFSDEHPDFEDTYNGEFPLITEMVLPELGDDDKPVLNVEPGGAIAVYIESLDKELSNVVLRMAHMDEVLEATDGDYSHIEDDVHYKYDGLSGHTGRFDVPAEYGDHRIIGLWVKAGNNASGDGPGYGEEIEGEYVEYDDVGPVSADSGDFDVTFIAAAGVPRQWRIESEYTFKQWHRNTEGVNQSIPFTIELDNGRSGPGGTYRYERSQNNGKPFFPIDGELLGNEDRSHNHHFTYEIATTFHYTDPATRDEPMVLTFSGDDDVWVFINRKLVIDLGGVHQEAWRQVDLDAKAAELGLEPGKTYPFHFFYAERHTNKANLTLETNIPFNGVTYD